MAISKSIIKQNGLATNYHKISNISLEFINHKCSVVLESYVSKDIRDKGIKAEKAKDDLQKLISQYELAKDGEIIKSLEEKINTFQELNKDILNENYIADQTLIELSFIPEDTSFAGIYNELMKLDDFKDSNII